MDSFFSQLVLSDDFKDRLSRHLLFWVASWIFQGVLYGFINSGPIGMRFVWSFIQSFFFMPQHIFLSYGIIYYALPRFFFKEKYWTGMFIVLALIVITALLSPATQFLAIQPFLRWAGYHGDPPKNIFSSFLGGLRGSMTVAGFATAIKLLKYWYLKKNENDRLEKEKLKAELELLKRQLHPHFMFNTLNSIYALALTNSNQTAEAILKLSNLMRYMMAESAQPVIALTEEIKIIKTYMDLEKSRFGSRLDITINIEGDFNNKTIAPLLLLPFVENSFKHGSNTADQVWISFDLSVKDNELKFKIINGKQEETDPHVSSGIGLSNVRKRLKLLYPKGHDLRIIENNDAFIVNLTLQLNKIHSPS